MERSPALHADLLTPLRESLGTLLPDSDEDIAQRLSSDARSVWARFYDETIVTRRYSVEVTWEFDKLLFECELTLTRFNAKRKIEYVNGYIERIRWYRFLLTTLRTKGIDALHQAIEQSLITLQKNGHLDLS